MQTLCTSPSPNKKVRKDEQRKMAKAIVTHAGAGEWTPQALGYLLTWLGQVNKILESMDESLINDHMLKWSWKSPPNGVACAYVIQLWNPSELPEGVNYKSVTSHTALLLPKIPDPSVTVYECSMPTWLTLIQTHKGGPQLL
jgi:hypothetical protein